MGAELLSELVETHRSEDPLLEGAHGESLEPVLAHAHPLLAGVCFARRRLAVVLGVGASVVVVVLVDRVSPNCETVREVEKE